MLNYTVPPDLNTIIKTKIVCLKREVVSKLTKLLPIITKYFGFEKFINLSYLKKNKKLAFKG
jgi:hypothetical protein